MDEEKYIIYYFNPNTKKPTFYGWTDSKVVKKAFLRQRTKGRYRSVRMSVEEILHYYGEDASYMENRIDFIHMHSNRIKGDITIFTTRDELRIYETKAQEMLRDACKLSKMGGDTLTLVNIVTHLDPYYGDALYYIGYRPPEIDTLYASMEEEYMSPTEQQLDYAYNPDFIHPEDEDWDHRPPGLNTLQDVYSKIIYSLESFVMVMKDYL